MGSGQTDRPAGRFFERIQRPVRAETTEISQAARQPVVRPAQGTNVSAAGGVRKIAQGVARAAEAAETGNWGWLPALVLVASVGLVSVGRAMQLGAEDRPGAAAFLWLGLLIIYAPVALRMALPQAQRRERIALAVWLGLALYLVKILRSPTGFIFHDEFPHFATADAILRTQHLFAANSLQRISAYFPGLELVTAALAQVSGLPIESAGLIVVGVARLLASLAIYLLYEEISGSPRVAGIGSVLAITYPNYLFWSSQYSYESLALPLAVLVLLVGLLRGRRNAVHSSLVAVAAVLIAAVVVTHHVTSYWLALTLIALFLVVRYSPRAVIAAEQLAARLPRSARRFLPWTLWTRPTEHTTSPRDWAPLAAWSVGFVVLWRVLEGKGIGDYLSPHLKAAAQGFLGLITRSNSGRAPFSTATATTAAPVWEQLVAFAAVLLIVAVIPFGLLQIWRRYRHHGLALLFAVVTSAYPLTLILRLSRGGAEIANRSWDFIFIALGFVLATAVAELWVAHEHPLPRAGLFAGYASVLLVGAFIVGTPDWARLPGSFMVGGDTRGLQPESYAVTDWTRNTLGPDNRFIADYSNKLLLGSFGEQYIVEGASWVYLSPTLRPNAELADLVKRNVAYVVVDDRLTTDVPRIGHYFEPGEPGSPWTRPLQPAYLTKFDKQRCLSRIFDSGHIAIYHVSAICAPSQGGTK